MRTLLQAGLEHYGLDPGKEYTSTLLEYISLLYKWNKTYNLTAVRDEEEMIRRHLLDSLSIHTYISGQRCLDVGTGPGLPGLVLAIVQPDKHWTLLDSNIKKVRFLRHVKTKLNLANIDVIHSRVESLQDNEGFSTIVCRAFSSLPDFYQHSQHLLHAAGIMLSMKARIDNEELKQVEPLVKQIEKIQLDLFDDDSQRCLIRMLT